MKIQLVGGKKHQIRAHLSQCLETPVLFDTTYGFLRDNNPFMNTLISTLYRDNPDYHSFKETIYPTLTQNRSVFRFNGEDIPVEDP